MTNQYISQAKAIAKEILKKCKRDKGEIIWKIEKRDKLDNLLRSHDYCLDSGQGGIILFFAELYALTKQQYYLNVVKAALKGLTRILKEEPSSNFGFFSGKTGIVFVLVRLYEITQDENYLNQAALFSSGCVEVLESDHLDNSYIEGRAGILIVLLYLFQYRHEPYIMKAINVIVGKLLVEATYTDSSASWYLNYSQISNHCGFGYGTSGIAYVLHELRKFLRYKTHDKLLLRAIHYTDSQWNKSFKNWPNFDYEIQTPEQDLIARNAFGNPQKSTIILNGKNEINYRHGSIGVMISKLRISRANTNNLTPPPYVNEVLQGLAKQDLGGLGIEDLTVLQCVLGLYKTHFANRMTIRLATKINKNNPIDLARRIQKEDIGLKNGLSGLGYHYVFKTAHKITPYFCPVIKYPDTSLKFFNSKYLYKETEFNKLIFAKYFPVTLSLLDEKPKGYVMKLVENYTGYDILSFMIKKMDSILEASEADIQKHEMFRLESLKCKMLDEPQKSGYFFSKRADGFLLNRKLQKMNDSDILKMSLILNDSLKIFKSIDMHSNAIDTEMSESYFLLTYTDQKEYVHVRKLSDFDELLINFETPNTGDFLLKGILQQIKPNVQKKALTEKIIELILTYVQDSILIPVNKNRGL